MKIDLAALIEAFSQMFLNLGNTHNSNLVVFFNTCLKHQFIVAFYPKNPKADKADTQREKCSYSEYRLDFFFKSSG